MNRLNDVERKLVALWEDVAESRGFDRIHGNVLYSLLTSRHPLSQREMAERTGYSIPTISKALKTLIPLGSVLKRKHPGQRTTSYYVEMHPTEMLSGALVKWIRIAQTMEQRLATIHQELHAAKHDDPERAGELIDSTQQLLDQIPKMTAIIEKALHEIRELH